MLKFSQFFLHCSKTFNRPLCLTRINELSSTVAEASRLTKNPSVEENINHAKKEELQLKSENRMVSAAFAALNDKTISSEIHTPETDNKINNATSVSELLAFAEGSGISRKLALKIVSILADWTLNKKINLADFERDPRFIKLCKILTRNVGNKPNLNYITNSKNEDLSTILSITADDEAAKMVQNITLPQMVKVMSALATKRRRSTLLLRTLAYNISGCPDRVTLKQCSDLLYSMATLNFLDDNLLSRITNDICGELDTDCKKSALVGSIVTSLGILKYKNEVTLDAIVNWMANNSSVCRFYDIFALFMTLATLNFQSRDSEKQLQQLSMLLNPAEAGRPATWLKHVWALALLNVAKPQQISEVLSDNFIQSLQTSKSLNSTAQLMLLNINGAAEVLLKDYSGNTLPADSFLRSSDLVRRKEKIDMSDSIVDTLGNLIQSKNNIRTNIDTGYGFYIDAECVVDGEYRIQDINKNDSNCYRVAFMSYDYHDMTRGKVDLTGINAFAKTLLESKGYKVLSVPYSEFKPKDNLIVRVKYLESKLKELFKS